MSRDAIRRLDRETAFWAARLSPDERLAIRRWQARDRYYETIQHAVLHPDDATAEELLIATLLFDATGHVLDDDVQAWRGIRSSARAFGVRADLLGRLVGRTFSISRFTSVTINRSIAVDQFTRPPLDGGPVLLRVTVLTGTNIGWIAQVGDPAERAQAELLLRAGHTMRIVNVDRTYDIPIMDVEMSR